MSSNLLSSLQSQSDKTSASSFDNTWCHQNNYIYIVLSGNEFLSDKNMYTVKFNTKELLIHNKWNNPNLWCTYLHYKLKNRSPRKGYNLTMDYAIVISVSAQNLSENSVDALPNKEVFLTELYYSNFLMDDDLIMGGFNDLFYQLIKK